MTFCTIYFLSQLEWAGHVLVSRDFAHKECDGKQINEVKTKGAGLGKNGTI